MSQQLIIQNDEEADYVQFTVEIPDGYAGFSISSINGTMINQNYLNIGDVLRFKFSNNPIIYNDAPYITLTDCTSDIRLTTTRNDDTPYEFMKFDLFSIYRVKFIPIYSYYDSDEGLSGYIFNPADDSQLLPEPTRKIPDYAIQTGDNPIYASFTGAFIISLDKVDKINDIDITVGESIANSKTQPTDITLNEAGEITASNQVGSTYNYGSYWRYDVHNLLMNHRLTVISVDKEIEETKQLCFYLGRVEQQDGPPTLYTSSLKSININESITYKFKFSNRPSPYFYFYYYNSNQFDKIPNTINIQLDKRQEAMIVKKSGANYEEIKFVKNSIDSPTSYLPDGCKIPGSTMNDTNYAIAEIKYNEEEEIYETDFKPISFPVMNDAYYTGNNVIIEVRGFEDLANRTITFTDFDTSQLIICDGQTEYNISINTEPPTQDTIVFYQYQSSAVRKTGLKCILGQSITLDRNQRYQFIRTINTGYIGTNDSEEDRIDIFETDNRNEEEEADENDINYNLKLSEPIQLTSINGEAADDDLIIKHIKDDTTNKHGMLIHTKPLSNTQYICSKVSGKNRYKTTFSMMTGSGDVASKVFIPKKSNNPLVPYTNSNLELVDGLMLIQDIYGANLKELSNDKSNLFLATGHETLNISPPQSDDYKFKTFNGSITFDRSLTKITRLFSMSNSNSCIGYINDILSAKLSRYYFAANYGIFNVYFDDSSFIPFSNSMNQIKTIYNKFKDKTYSGIHEILLANCGDIVKLIGSDVITNNCMPGITPEEHIINADEVLDFNSINDIESIDMKPFYYKLFHYYNSGFNNYPSIGGDDVRPNGATFLHNHSSFIIQSDDEYTNAPGVLSQHAIFISNKSRAQESIDNADVFIKGYDNIETVEDMTIDFLKELENNSSNKHVSFLTTYQTSDTPPITKTANCGGFINVLPAPRVYRNNNFEQSDLTISTGRIKTLSPIYIQSVNRILLNNILYMFDMMINIIETKYESIQNSGDTYDYFLVLNNSLNDLAIDGEAVLKRFGLSAAEEVGYLPISLDSALIMNYLNSANVNEYADNDELLNSLPIKDNEANNEEIIGDIITFRPETNIQLFSSRYFNFHENISTLSEILWVQVLNRSTDLNNKNLWMYFGEVSEANNKDETYICLAEYINNFYSNIVLNNSYNICRTVKTMISKLGEFLDFPKIVFGTTLAFNQSKTVNIQYMNPIHYTSEFQSSPKIDEETKTLIGYEENYYPNQKQKNNVAMFGVIFKYHQLSLGWQQMINDLQETFVISRAKGQKHFVVKIYDEFGRQIPNMDTSQGFKNNLRLEINCFNG